LLREIARAAEVAKDVISTMRLCFRVAVQYQTLLLWLDPVQSYSIKSLKTKDTIAHLASMQLCKQVHVVSSFHWEDKLRLIIMLDRVLTMDLNYTYIECAHSTVQVQ